MKIAIYYPWIYLKSGVERTILEMVSGSRHDFTIFTNHYDKDGTYPEFKKLKVVEMKRIPVQRSIRSALKAALTIATQKINLKGFDTLIIHSEGLGDLFLIRNNGIPSICFCHTPLRPVFDPEYKKRAIHQRGFFRKSVYLLFDYSFKIIDRILWKRYRYIFFNSKETLSRAKKGRLLSRKTKYEILHPGVDWEKIKPTWNYKKYILIPGRIMWTKNIELAIDSFKLFSAKNKDFKLIISGMLDKKSGSYFRWLKLLSKPNKNIGFIINPSDNRMRSLYANCFAVLATAFNEDWGLTPVEANAYGKAVIAVNRGGFKESQVNRKTGYLTVFNAWAIADKLANLARNPDRTRKMGVYARKYSQKFSWIIFNKRVNEVIDHL